MDTILSERGLFFELHRAEVVERRVASARIVDALDVVEHNGRFREECLNAHWFLSLDDARGKIEAWRVFYNESQPHSALGATGGQEHRKGLEVGGNR